MELSSYISLLIGSFVLSFVHALIPNHWLPLVALSRSQRWTQRETMIFTGIVGGAHVLGTIICGVIVALCGLTLAESYASLAQILGTALLVGLGGYFVYSGWQHAHHCRHHDVHLVSGDPKPRITSKLKLVVSLSLSMLLSPCIEIVVYFLGASAFGWEGVMIISLMFVLVTVPLLMLLVYVAAKGVAYFNWPLLDHHGRTITGIVLMLIGLSTYFVDLPH